MGDQTCAISAAGRIASGIGNTLFLGLLGAGSFFGYYTYRYTTDEVNDMVAEAEKPENSFPGSQVIISMEDSNSLAAFSAANAKDTEPMEVSESWKWMDL